LGVESRGAHMHVGAVLIFEPGPLLTADGRVDFARIRAYVASALDRLPRCRQHLRWIPGLRHPVWVDHEHFQLDYHLRHTALPRPGDERLLKRLAGRIFSQRLDRSHPLWEFWVVEGLEGGRFALIPKVHHCMVDGIAGADFMAALLRGTPDDSIPAAKPWTAQRAPHAGELLAEEIRYRAHGVRAAGERLVHGIGDGRRWVEDARRMASGVARTVSAALVSAPATPLNPDRIGPHRRFDVCRFDLEQVKAVKRCLGGTVNDVVLATVAGALARFLGRRGLVAAELGELRALIPVNVRDPDRHGALGNRVALMLARLPIGEPDPRRRLQRVETTTGELKHHSMQAESARLLEELSDYTASSLLVDTFRIAAWRRAFNVVITNVPGPQFPLYLVGARLQAVYPMVPLFEKQALGIALFSYDGGLYWGVSADWHAVPDLHDFIGDLGTSFAELCAA
jgi:diacylglycerol O-acyltransferase / wax synthase